MVPPGLRDWVQRGTWVPRPISQGFQDLEFQAVLGTPESEYLVGKPRAAQEESRFHGISSQWPGCSLG